MLHPSGETGPLHTAHGGVAVGKVVVAGERFPSKAVDSVEHTPLVLRYRLGSFPQLESKIADFLAGTKSRFDGEVLDTDSSGDVISRLPFTGAQIVGVKLPALDSESADQAHITVRLAVKRSTRGRPGGRVRSTAQSKWQRSSFHFQLDGAHEAAESVTTVAAQIVRLDRGRYEVPNLIVRTRERDADALFDWHHRFVVRGDSTDERGASLEYLSREGRLGEVRFSGVGILSVAAVAPRGGTRMVQAEMFCETVTLSGG